MSLASGNTTAASSWIQLRLVILGAAATRTKNIRLTSAVTVLSAADPVRIFQEFATLDLISHGRAEIVAGRGSSIEAFPLFGFDSGESADGQTRSWVRDDGSEAVDTDLHLCNS